MSKIKIAIIQMRMVSSRVKNLNNAIHKIRKAHQKGAKVICLPELFLTNYFCQVEKHSNFKLAEKIPGPTSDILCSLCKELKIILLVSLFEKKTAGIYHNTCIVIDKTGKIISKHKNNNRTVDRLWPKSALQNNLKSASPVRVDNSLESV